MAMNAQQKVKEFLKCKKDIFYFAKIYVKLSLPGGSVTPKMYPPQEQFLRDLLRVNYVALLKTRQTGGSTAAQIFCAWLCTFYKNAVIGIVSRKGDEATDFARKVMMLLYNLPAWMQPKFLKDTERTFILDNGCQLFAESVNAGNPGSLFRGKAITLGIIDEAAHIPFIDEACTAFAPALFKSHQVAREKGVPFGMIVISTPNRTLGTGKFFFDIWKEAVAGTGMFHASKLYWKDIPEFVDDPTWYDTQCKLLGGNEGKIAQELEMQFIGSENTWLPLNVLKKLFDNVKKPTSSFKMRGGLLYMWEEILPTKYYLIGIDVASAGGSDKSTIEVYDYETMNQVAEFRGKLEVFDFCENIRTVAKLFVNHLLIPEDNSYGTEVVGYIRRLEDVPVNLYRMSPTKQLKEATAKVKRYGFNTNTKSRPMLMDSLYTFITQYPDCIKSESLVLELAGLIEKQMATSFKVEADKGVHDDLVMASGFCTYVRQYDPPVGIATGPTGIRLSDDIHEVAEWNDDLPGYEIGETLSSDTVSVYSKLPGGVSLEQMNRDVLKKAKENMHKLADQPGGSQNSILNPFDIMGWNTDD